MENRNRGTTMQLERTQCRYGSLKIYLQRGTPNKHWIIIENRAILIRINDFNVTETSVMRTDFTIIDPTQTDNIIETEAIATFIEAHPHM